jgi:hypothetical protein
VRARVVGHEIDGVLKTITRLSPLPFVEVVGPELHVQHPIVGREADRFLQRRLHGFRAALARLQFRECAVRRGVERIEPERGLDLMARQIVLIGEGVEIPERDMR